MKKDLKSIDHYVVISVDIVVFVSNKLTFINQSKLLFSPYSQITIYEYGHKVCHPLPLTLNKGKEKLLFLNWQTWSLYVVSTVILNISHDAIARQIFNPQPCPNLRLSPPLALLSLCVCLYLFASLYYL